MIESYSFGQITIGGREFTADVIIYPGHVDDKWWRAQGHHCCLEDLPGVWQHHPASLVIGTGDPGLMGVDDDLKDHCASKGIELLIQPTAQAVDAFNQRQQQGMTVIAALHLTC